MTHKNSLRLPKQYFSWVHNQCNQINTVITNITNNPDSDLTNFCTSSLVHPCLLLKEPTPTVISRDIKQSEIWASDGGENDHVVYAVLLGCYAV
jgi:hypothetical protein